MYRFATLDEYEIEIAVLEYTIQEAKEEFDLLKAENVLLAQRIKKLEQILKDMGLAELAEY